MNFYSLSDKKLIKMLSGFYLVYMIVKKLIVYLVILINDELLYLYNSCSFTFLLIFIYRGTVNPAFTSNPESDSDSDVPLAMLAKRTCEK